MLRALEFTTNSVCYSHCQQGHDFSLDAYWRLEGRNEPCNPNGGEPIPLCNIIINLASVGPMTLGKKICTGYEKQVWLLLHQNLFWIRAILSSPEGSLIPCVFSNHIVKIWQDGKEGCASVANVCRTIAQCSALPSH